MKNKKKRAFTLTELLIVVIVIGVLSAVVLPKFSKVIETRKTTEAEEMMAAVRTEQEQRCSLNKLYTNDFAKLENALPASETQNYTYNLRGASISATSKGSLNYTLKMPSFADGRICCDTEAEGNQCANLNKEYPACNELIARADYTQAEAECTPEIPCTGSAQTRACQCASGYTGTSTETETQTCVNGNWQWPASSCVSTVGCNEIQCTGDVVVENSCTPNGYWPSNCGKKTHYCNTATKQWKTGSAEWSACSTGSTCYAIECTADVPNQSCTPTGYTPNCGKRTHYCNTSTKKWKTGDAEWSSCSTTSSCQRTCSGSPGTYYCDCESGYTSSTGHSTAQNDKVCDDGDWVVPSPKCKSTAGCTYQTSNPNNPSGSCNKPCSGSNHLSCCVQWGYSGPGVSGMVDENGNQYRLNFREDGATIITEWVTSNISTDENRVFSFYYALPPGSYDTSGLSASCLKYAPRTVSCDYCTGTYHC